MTTPWMLRRACLPFDSFVKESFGKRHVCFGAQLLARSLRCNGDGVRDVAAQLELHFIIFVGKTDEDRQDTLHSADLTVTLAVFVKLVKPERGLVLDENVIHPVDNWIQPAGVLRPRLKHAFYRNEGQHLLTYQNNTNNRLIF